MLIAFAYGLFNSLGLGRSEKQVTWETLGVAFFLTVAFSAFYCLRKSTSTETSKVIFKYAHLGEVFRQNRKIFEVGLASLVVLLALSLAIHLPNSRVQAAGIGMQLRRALSSPDPSDPNTIKEITTAFRMATADRVSINPKLANVAGKRVVEASRENPDAWSAALAFMSYRSTLNQEMSSLKKGTCIKVGDVSGIAVHVSESVLANCSQELDHVAWKNVVFENVTVVYHGSPTVLENVQFKNCQFSLDYTLSGQALAKSLAVSNNLTITLPGS